MDAAGPEVLATRLREAGLRLTTPRRAVYAALRRLRGHRSADEVLVEIRLRGPDISRMSVYNALADLHGAGLLLRADAGPGRALYEANATWHHHFVCRRCARVVDVPCVKGEKPCLKLSAKVGKADEAQIIFRGVCRRCGGY